MYFTVQTEPLQHLYAAQGTHRQWTWAKRKECTWIPFICYELILSRNFGLRAQLDSWLWKSHCFSCLIHTLQWNGSYPSAAYITDQLVHSAGKQPNHCTIFGWKLETGRTHWSFSLTPKTAIGQFWVEVSLDQCTVKWRWKATDCSTTKSLVSLTNSHFQARISLKRYPVLKGFIP